jgi:hypothetical protein
VNAAIAASSTLDGDTVELTCSGSVTWTAAVTIPSTKGITLQVKGATNTPMSAAVFPLTVICNLATAIVVNVAAYVFSVVPVSVFDTREIVAVLPFGAVLAGRMVPRRLAGVPRRLKPALAGASAGVLACYLTALGYGAAQRPVANSEQAIVPWLEAHHLTSGLGTYAEANLITLDSGGRIAVREVTWRPSGDTRRSFESKASWYDPRQSYANFILTNSADQWGMDGGGPHRLSSMIPRSAIAALHAGPPAHVYHYKTFTIMVWNHNLLENLGKTPSVQPGDVPCTHDCV